MATQTKEKTATGPEIKMIPVNQIIPDPNQPRKLSSEKDNLELATSIASNGVIQPISLRQVKTGKKLNYMVVFGHRRLWAVKYNMKLRPELKMDYIPAIIQDISDEEALELQIVENLQRKDVHPMDEAFAFLQLYNRHPMKEITERVGKSESYVAKRLNLNDLIEGYKRLFKNDQMSLTTAFQISRLGKESQEELYKATIPDDDDMVDDYFYDVSEWDIKRQSMLLEKATFDTEDEDLYPEAGACSNCPHNSHYNKLLFPDKSSPTCSNAVCFQIKQKAAYKASLEEVIEDTDVPIVCDDYYLSTEGEERIKAAEEMNLKIFARGDFEKIKAPEKPEPYEEFKDDYMCYMDDEEQKDPEKLAECQKEYDEKLEEYEEELAEYKEKIKSAQKAFSVTDGKTIYVKMNEKAAKKSDNPSSNIDDEIAKIEAREKRNKELDAEKVWAKVRGLLDDEENRKKVFHTKEELSYAETLAANNAIGMAIDYPHSHWKHEFEEREEETPSPNELHGWLRILIMDKLICNYGSHISNEDNRTAYKLLEKIFPDEIAEFELDQQSKADQRAERVAKRIAALEKKK